MPLASPLLAFAIVRLCFAQFYFENHQSVLGSPTPMVRPIFTLPHALGVQLGGRRGNAANGVPGEGRQFQLQSGQGRQRTTARPAFADTHASSTARRNSLHRSHGLAKALRSGIRLVESFLTGLSYSSRTSRNRLPADCRYGVTTAIERSTALC